MSCRESYSSLTLFQVNFIGCLCLDRCLRAVIARRITEVKTPEERAMALAKIVIICRVCVAFARGRVSSQVSIW